jgi:large conductance mechanosensitive channel
MAEKQSMWKEFKEFAVRGNVLDLAVAVIIGGAFGKIVNSLVNDIVMPPLGVLLGGVDFTNQFIALDGRSYRTLEEAKTAGAATLNIGVFFETVVDFLIIAFAIFIVVRQVNRFRKGKEPTEPVSKECTYCFSSIPIKAVRCPNCTSELPKAA